jgi:hypothetical protein
LCASCHCLLQVQNGWISQGSLLLVKNKFLRSKKNIIFL